MGSVDAVFSFEVRALFQTHPGCLQNSVPVFVGLRVLFLTDWDSSQTLPAFPALWPPLQHGGFSFKASKSVSAALNLQFPVSLSSRARYIWLV